MNPMFELDLELADVCKSCTKLIDEAPNVALRQKLHGDRNYYIMAKLLSTCFGVIAYLLILILSEMRKQNRDR